MASKEDKKSKASKTEASSSGADTPKKKDSVETMPEVKGKGKREKTTKIGVPPGPVVIDHSGLIDKKHTDSTLVVGTSILSVHKAIISARNDQILQGVAPKKNKKGGFDYDLKDVEFPIMRIVVQWLYSDKIDLPSIALTDVVKVIKAAHHYQMERLSQLCEAHLQANLSLDNLWDVLSLAHTQKVERAKTLCMEFAYTHHDAVLGDPRFRKLEVDLIVDEAQLYSKYRAQLEGGWRPPAVEVTAPSTMVEDFKQLYDSMTGADHTVVVEKQPIRCHKAILGHASPTLMEFADAKDKEPLPKEFKSVSANTFSALLRYLYYGNTDIEPMAATQLISFAKQLGLTTLVDICEAKIRHGIDNSTCLSILEVAYHPILKDRDELQKELKTNCRSYFIDHIREIDVAPLKSMDAAIGADLLLSVQKQIGVHWSIGEGAHAANGNMTPSSSGTHVAGDKHRKKASRMSSSFEAKKTGTEDDHSGAEAHASVAPLSPGGTIGNAVAASAADDSDDSESHHSKSKEEKPASIPSAAAAAHAAAHAAAIEESKSDAQSSSQESAPATPIAVAASIAEDAAAKKDDKAAAAEEPASPAPVAAEKHEDEITSVPSSPKVHRSESKREKKDKLKDKDAAAAAPVAAEEEVKKDKKEDSGSKKDEEGKKDKKDKKDKKEKEKSKDKKKKE